ncbi:MAG: glycosyltransferase family 2 protein [Patescibacteria group bacterium]
MKISCVLPALNEEKNITTVISSLRPYVHEIIVVDDGSTDSTAQLAAQSGAIVIKHPINRGQGAALETGDNYALKNGADLVIHFDADGQFLATEIPELIEPILKNQADIVFGSRFLSKKTAFPFGKKYIIMPLAKFFTRFFLGIKLSDPQSGLRALSRVALKTITINNQGMAHASEIQIKAFQNKLRVVEVPITVIYQDFGQKLSGGFRIIRDLLINKLIK